MWIPDLGSVHIHVSFYHDGLIYNFEIICSDLDTYQNYNPNHKWSGDETDWDGLDFDGLV